MLLFLFLYMLLLCSFVRLKELFQVKNGVTTSLLFFFFLKMPKIWVGQTTVNGEKKRMALAKEKNQTYSRSNLGRSQNASGESCAISLFSRCLQKNII